MEIKNDKLEIDKKALRELYNCHWQQGLRFDFGVDTFQDVMEAYLTPYTDFLFDVLPKCPRLQSKYFDNLTDGHLLQLHALANICNVTPPVTHDSVKANTLPDIKMERTAEGTLEVSTFHGKIPHIHTVAKAAIEHFWDNFSLEEIRDLSEKDQALLVSLFEKFDITPDRQPGQHLKLSYGLHLPKELLDFNTQNLKKLAARIMVNEDLHDGLACFLDEGHSEEIGLPYIQHEGDKRRLTNTFMNVMAQIWQIPDPVQEDYDKAPKLDKNGKEFSEYMHAFYVAAANDNEPGRQIGLIYGANTHKGYLNGDRRFAIKAISHEFGHLLSNFIVSAHANKALIDAQKRKEDIRNAEVLALENTRNVLSVNNMYALNGRYYNPTATLFNGLNTSKGDHVYKGQLEERHADWMGAQTVQYIDFALENRNYIDDFDDTKRHITCKIKGIVSHIAPKDTAPALFQSIIEDIQYTKSFDELEKLTNDMRGSVQKWFSDNFRRTAANKEGTAANDISQPNRAQLIQSYQFFGRLKKYCDVLFDVRRIALDYGYEKPAAAQNALTAE